MEPPQNPGGITSTTFGALRRARHEYARRRALGGAEPVDAWGRPEDQGATVQMGSWSYAGLGYRTAADAWLAWSMRQDAREQRRIVREELTAVA